MRIIIVEDEIVIREGIVKLIKKANNSHEIVGQAENGKEGLELIREKKPDLVITDIRMSEMDGLVMLQRLKKMNVSVKAIILSAYSEFSYAQQAVKLGVNEYLLKPIAVAEFTQSLKNIENQLEQERQMPSRRSDALCSVENVLSNILLSGMPVDEETNDFLVRINQMNPCGEFLLLLNYLGDQYDSKKDRMEQKLSSHLNGAEKFKYCFLKLSGSREILIFLYAFQNPHEIERWFQITVLPNIRREIDFHMCFGLTYFQDLMNFKDSYDKIHQCMDWNIVLGNEIIVSYPKVVQIQTVPLSYPIEIENRMRAALCSMDQSKIKRESVAFENYFKQGNIYGIKEIKNSFVRFIWNIISILKEIDFNQYEMLEQTEYLEKIMSSITWGELIKPLDKIIQVLKIGTTEDNQSVSLVVQRAKSLVHEFYCQGITLDEIALRLKITPEYLSTQFHREVGTNFSMYIKTYRVGRAKELLLGTDLKLFQIAEKVGYKDPKHFSKVFNEIVGEMPTEYRNLHK